LSRGEGQRGAQRQRGQQRSIQDHGQSSIRPAERREI
jgi:hypothetical protein